MPREPRPPAAARSPVPEAAGPAAGWRAAAERALYGPGGFFLREAPASHFRTSVHASPLFAAAVARLLLRVDEALGRPAELALVDMGAGRGELAAGVLTAVPEPVAARLRVYAVERADRPAGLDPRIAWLAEPPQAVVGLLFANEWLDNVPLDVAETDDAGVPRYVLVDAAGRERLGATVSGADAAWLRRWWPLSPQPEPESEPEAEAVGTRDGGTGSARSVPRTGAGARPKPGRPRHDTWAGARAEIGRSRDEAWAAALSCLARGVAVAVDYAHTLGGRPPLGTLTGYRDGRAVAPVPDGSCDLTAHVALDACAAAGPGGAVLLTQRAALRALGVDGRRPPEALAARDPVAYLRELSRCGEAAELIAPDGLGAFGWLVQPVGTTSPL